MTFAVFHDYPGLEYGLPKFHDFPGPVVTLFYTGWIITFLNQQQQNTNDAQILRHIKEYLQWNRNYSHFMH